MAGRALAVLLMVGFAGVGCAEEEPSTTTPAEKEAPAKKPKKKERRPSYIRAFERAVKQDELLYLRSQGMEGETRVRCFDTRVERGSKLAAGCEADSVGTATGDLLDAEELPTRFYEVQYERGNPKNFTVLAPGE